MEPGKSIQFIRTRDYVWMKELGQGASGKTALLRDDVLDELFVCKKYSPIYAADRDELFGNFVREIKLLHKVHHHHVVRVFNYYLYPKEVTGYILMEYVNGKDIEDHLRKAPEQINEIFVQAIEGFQYLEANKILHRDIRPQNILVREDGVLKIIDLGFGKRVIAADDFDKSISLNWWCEPPNEFAASTYDFRTEVYFVGKLFEKIIQESSIDHFKYTEVLSQMCVRAPKGRIASFFDVQKAIKSDLFYEIEFEDDERDAYQAFSNAVMASVTKVETGTKYFDDVDRIKSQLETVYRRCMLETMVPDGAAILRCFLSGTYYCYKDRFEVQVLRDFVRLLKAAPLEKQRIILANLQSRLDAVNRYTQGGAAATELDDDIPF